MALTTAQLTTLKTHITSSGDLNVLPNSSDGNVEVARLLNLAASPDWYVWRNLPMETVLNLITFASMTPADAVPTTPDLTVQVFKARAIVCQGKQFNLQNLTLGRTTAPMKLTNYRAALQDCLTGIPAGASGALIAANWTGVRDAAKFLATRFEKLYTTGTGTQATPADLVIEGNVTPSDVDAARNLP